jgi:imidazole glycerol-phosphate synthase subunit HisH
MRVAVVKYNAGNIRSVENALNRLGVNPELTDDPETLLAADKVIFPGVGEASTAMAYLRERTLDSVIRSLTQPVLGICLGMQLLCSYSEENDTECLGILPHKVRKFEIGGLKVPHIGWNNFFNLGSMLFDGVAEDSFAYFVHGYFVETGEETVATANYGIDFSAAIQHENFYAVQFHPEKSGNAGSQILENFVNL